jgi:DNA-binding beta-propeller fold protein YncE
MVLNIRVKDLLQELIEQGYEVNPMTTEVYVTDFNGHFRSSYLDWVGLRAKKDIEICIEFFSEQEWRMAQKYYKSVTVIPDTQENRDLFDVIYFVSKFRNT